MQIATPAPDVGPSFPPTTLGDEPSAALADTAGRGFPPLVMVVDDDPLVLGAVRRALARLPVRLVVFSHPREALEFLPHNDPALIISDFHMPGLDGAQLLDAAHALCPLSVRALFTGRADLQVVSEAASRGALSSVIAKPWEEAKLVQTIMELAAAGLNARIAAGLPAFQAGLMALPSTRACVERLRGFLVDTAGLEVIEAPPNPCTGAPRSVYCEGTGSGLGVELTDAHLTLVSSEAQRSRLLALLESAVRACLFASASRRA